MTTPDQRPPSGPGPTGPAGPTTDPQRRPDEPPSDPEAIAAAGRAALTFVLFVIASLITLTMPLPWQLATLAFTVGAVVTGIRALLTARRAGRGRGLAPLLVVGIALTMMIAISVLSAAVVYDLSVARQECLARALTTSATEACESGFRTSVEERLAELTDRATGSR